MTLVSAEEGRLRASREAGASTPSSLTWWSAGLCSSLAVGRKASVPLHVALSTGRPSVLKTWHLASPRASDRSDRASRCPRPLPERTRHSPQWPSLNSATGSAHSGPAPVPTQEARALPPGLRRASTPGSAWRSSVRVRFVPARTAGRATDASADGTASSAKVLSPPPRESGRTCHSKWQRRKLAGQGPPRRLPTPEDSVQAPDFR